MNLKLTDHSDLPGEEWRPVPGHEPYEASSKGRVRRDAHVLAGTITDYGYYRISTCIASRRKQVHVHLMVLLAFVGPRPSPQHTVAHGPRGKLVNEPSNLRWATGAEQYQDRLRDGTDSTGVNHPLAQLTPDQVQEIRRNYVPNSKSTGALALARKFGVGRGAIWGVLTGKTWRSIPREATR